MGCCYVNIIVWINFVRKCLKDDEVVRVSIDKRILVFMLGMSGLVISKYI